MNPIALDETNQTILASAPKANQPEVPSGAVADESKTWYVAPKVRETETSGDNRSEFVYFVEIRKPAGPTVSGVYVHAPAEEAQIASQEVDGEDSNFDWKAEAEKLFDELDELWRRLAKR